MPPAFIRAVEHPSMYVPTCVQVPMGEDLPAFTEEEKADLKGSIDFIGVHPYTAR